MDMPQTVSHMNLLPCLDEAADMSLHEKKEVLKIYWRQATRMRKPAMSLLWQGQLYNIWDAQRSSAVEAKKVCLPALSCEIVGVQNTRSVCFVQHAACKRAAHMHGGRLGSDPDTNTPTPRAPSPPGYPKR